MGTGSPLDMEPSEPQWSIAYCKARLDCALQQWLQLRKETRLIKTQLAGIVTKLKHDAASDKKRVNKEELDDEAKSKRPRTVSQSLPTQIPVLYKKNDVKEAATPNVGKTVKCEKAEKFDNVMIAKSELYDNDNSADGIAEALGRMKEAMGDMDRSPWQCKNKPHHERIPIDRLQMNAFCERFAVRDCDQIRF